MSKETRQAVLRNIGYLTQLGFSIAFPPIACSLGAIWLRDKYSLGAWVVLAGVVFGLVSGISCFMTFVKHVMRQSGKDK